MNNRRTKINYLGITLEDTGDWDIQKARLRAKDRQAAVAIGKCLVKTADVKVEILENVYEMTVESKMIYDVEMWGLEEALKEIDKTPRRFCKN
jgi:hypothetical protein